MEVIDSCCVPDGEKCDARQAHTHGEQGAAQPKNTQAEGARFPALPHARHTPTHQTRAPPRGSRHASNAAASEVQHLSEPRRHASVIGGVALPEPRGHASVIGGVALPGIDHLHACRWLAQRRASGAVSGG